MTIFNMRVQSDGETLSVLSIVPESPPEPTILGFIGDSNTDVRPAAGVTQPLTFTELVRAARGFNSVINAGVGGQTSAQMLARFDTDIIAKGVDHVCIDGGINGVMAGQTPAQYYADIRAMAEAALAADIAVTISTSWLVKTTAYINAMDPFMDKARSVAADLNLPLIDVYDGCIHAYFLTGGGPTFDARYADDQHQSVTGHAFRAGLYTKQCNWRACALPV